MGPETHCGDQAVFVDCAAGYSVALAEGALRISRHDEPVRLLPLRRVSRALLRQPRGGELCALLELASRGVPVHFQDGRGNITATLVSTDLQPGLAARELITCVEGRDPHNAYATWLDLQLRHGASRIIRRAVPGSIAMFERALEGYVARGIDKRECRAAVDEVRALCFAWIDGELTRLRLRRLMDALALYGCPLLRDLDRALAIPLLWRLAPWLRQHRGHTPRSRMAFFETLHRELEARLALALGALHHHLQSRRRATPAHITRARLRRYGNGGWNSNI